MKEGMDNGWMDGFGHSGLYSVKTPALQQMPQMPMFSYSLESVSNCQGAGTGDREVPGFSLKLLEPYS